jgi:hypothetical protein
MKKEIKNKTMIRWTGAIMFILLPYLSHGQWITNGNNVINTNTGNVGIGTAAPSAKLNVYNSGAATTMILGNPSTGTGGFTSLISGTSADVNGYGFVESVKSSGTAYGDVIISRFGGNVGIGTTTPVAKLHVNGNIKIDGKIIGPLIIDGNNEIELGNGISKEVNAGKITYQRFSDALDIVGAGTTNLNRKIKFWTEGGATFNGNVGIGTASPDAKLAVKGTIHAQEVKVDLSVPGPDYVFEPTYNLKPLTEIETYIKANKHLPEVPAAKEMEANGVQLGEMNMLLLKKIEELTLHLIELKKENESLKARVSKLEK